MKKFISAVILCFQFSFCFSQVTDALKLRIESGNYSDETVIRFVQGATNGFDSNYDAWKLFSSNTAVPNVFSKDSAANNLTINALPAFTSSVYMNLFLSIGVAGNYSFTPVEIGAFSPDVKIIMKDLSSGQLYDMRNPSSFTIFLPVISKADPSRFQLLFSYPAGVQANSASCAVCSDGKVSLSKNGQNNWQYSIYNSSSSLIANGTAQNYNAVIQNLQPGNYSAIINSDFSCSEVKSISIKSPATYYARMSGSWESPSTWSTLYCGGAAASSIPGNGDNVIICSGKKITVNSNTGCNHITIYGSLICNADLNITGNWINNGIVTTGSHAIAFSGDKLQVIGGNKVTTFGNVIINNSTPSEAVRLNISAIINGTLTLQDGHIITSSAKLLTCGPLSSIALAATPQDSSFIKGPMAHTVNATTPVIKIFPVGKENSYRRVDVTIDQKSPAKTIYTSEMFNDAASAMNYILPSTVPCVSDVRYYKIKQSPLTALDSANVKIYFGCSGKNDLVDSVQSVGIVKDNGMGTWIDLHRSAFGNNCSGIAFSKAFASFKGTTFSLSNTHHLLREKNVVVKPAEKEIENLFALYPNPASSFLTIELPEENSFLVTIVDMTGKICLNKNFSSGKEQINISDLPIGIYSVAVTNKNKSETKLLIKK